MIDHNLNSFLEGLSSENMDYIKDSFGSYNDAMDYYFKSAASDDGGYQDVDAFFSSLKNNNTNGFV